MCYMKGGSIYDDGLGCGNNDRKDSHEDCFRYFDDIYADTVLSRVILTDNSNWNNSTIFEPQIPSAWSNTSITCSANLGGLIDSVAYVFVFDSNNNRNTTGYLVSIGGEVIEGPPPASTFELHILDIGE